MPVNTLYSGGPITVSTMGRRVSDLLGLSKRGYKITFLRAGKNNSGTTWIAHSEDVSPSTATGFVDAGEALSFDHPRPDTFETWIVGTDLDVLYVTILAEAVSA